MQNNANQLLSFDHTLALFGDAAPWLSKDVVTAYIQNNGLNVSRDALAQSALEHLGLWVKPEKIFDSQGYTVGFVGFPTA